VSRPAPHVSFRPVDDELAHYTAGTALDDVLGWFVEDGYSADDLASLCEDHIDRVLSDD
jgi:hypothetical protein